MDITFDTGAGRFNYRVAAVLLDGERILAMHDERSPYFYLPGGRVRMGERAEDAVLREVREELGIEAKILRPLWLSQAFFNEDVTGLNAMAQETETLSPETVSAALEEYAGLTPGAVRSLEIADGTIRADLGEDFWQQVRSMGTSGELLLLGSVVNTLLDAFDAESVMITVNGQIPETGHNIYDFPLERCPYELGE